MGFVELLLLAIGLSMDAFAVSVCKGLAMKRLRFRDAAICGVWFGSFQALMPFVGYLLGSRFEQYIRAVSSWIAFILLALIGANMLREALSKEEEEHASAGLDFKTMLVMAVATSIDALAVGITFACVPLQLIAASELLNTLLGVCIIGLTTFAISCTGVKIGNVFGTRWILVSHDCQTVFQLPQIFIILHPEMSDLPIIIQMDICQQIFEKYRDD